MLFTDVAVIADKLAVKHISDETGRPNFTGNRLAKVEGPFADQPGPFFPAQQSRSILCLRIPIIQAELKCYPYGKERGRRLVNEPVICHTSPPAITTGTNAL